MKRKSIKIVEPTAYVAMLGLEEYGKATKLAPLLKELIKIRASQINGCAYCLDMHTQDALELGETPRRIFALSAWKESPLFSEEERAVLQLTEEVTQISKEAVADATYQKVLELYGENGIAEIIMLIIIINSWNRMAIATNQVFTVQKK